MSDETSSPQAICPRCGSSVAEDSEVCPRCEAPTERLARPKVREGRREAKTPGSSRSSSHPSASRFPPGMILAERYRVVSLLGRGGMGEVYRAEDLKLGQTVALKFVSQKLARSSEGRERLYQEVRLGRQISHPNVCRVYDVVEWNDELFVAMEYVDGEDLASLIRRIGALPGAKVAELAREIAAGLAAAHGLGVVHRDLKPANVMIDGRGRARITDFGLAVVAEDSGERREIAGTPVYMSPEQLRGEVASPRSDLYALGLLFYEMVTGRSRFRSGAVADLVSQHEQSDDETVGAELGEVDQDLRRVIERCLRERPEERPPSIQAVIAALPGGDPLQAALEAGETPSPELVASAEGSGELRPGTAILLLAAYVVLVLLSAQFAGRWGQVPGYIEVPEPPEALATRAGDLLQQVAGVDRGGDAAYGWGFDWDRRHWVVENGYDWWGRGREMAPSPVHLWYRYSPKALVPFNHFARVRPGDPPLTEPGAARVRLDAQGRLLELTTVPPERASDEEAAGENLWQELLRASGLDPETLRAAEPGRLPPVGSTGRRAWRGTYPGQPDLPIRVEAASALGRPVWFQVIPPWVAAGDEALPEGTASRRLWQLAAVFRGVMFLILIGLAAILARRNILQGRGDRRGALVLGLFVGSATFASLILQADFVSETSLRQVIRLFGFGISQGFAAWLLYLAAEPFLRRTWPRLMVGWHRLAGGRVRDARIGREVLLGLIAGTLMAIVAGELAVQVRLADIPYSPPLELVSRFRDVVAGVFNGLVEACDNPLFSGLALLVATLVFRRRVLAIAMLWVLVFVLNGSDIFDLRYALVFMFLSATVFILVLVRAGLLGLAAMTLASSLVDFPLTTDSTAWYFPQSLIPLLLLLAIGGWAAWRSLGDRADLRHLLGEGPRPPAGG